MNTSTQPVEVKTKAYIYGVDILDGNDAWALFYASAKGDIASVFTLLKKINGCSMPMCPWVNRTTTVIAHKQQSRNEFFQRGKLCNQNLF